MAYTPSEWPEHSMTEAAKITALNNLEGMYAEGISYVDAITHAATYYTQAQADGRFFTTANDGTGSGMICETLDGYTAAQIISAYIPAGIITNFAGAIVDIPSGWVLCNGSNDTPDLTDIFVMGVSATHAKGPVNGSSTVTTSGSVTIDGHALTRNEVPLHTHGYSDRYRTMVSTVELTAGTTANMAAPSDHASYTSDAGSGAEHDHDADYTGTTDQNKLPAYYALAFIMRQ